MTLWVVSSLGDGTAHINYSNGTAQELTNGIVLWQENQNITYATGPSVVTCPVMQIGKDSNYSMPLKNGKYLTLSAGYCQVQRDTTNYSYQQQTSSQAWQDAISILTSIKFN